MRKITKPIITAILSSVVIGLVLFMAINSIKADITEPFTNPHGNYDVSGSVYGTDKCGKCHSGHTGLTAGLLSSATQRETCYGCHGLDNGVPNIRKQLGEATIGSSVYAGGNGSFHPIPAIGSSGNQYLCTECHDPHLATEDSPGGTSSLLSVGEAAYSSGNVVCGSCHLAGGPLAYGDLYASFANTPHDTEINGPSTGTGIKCARCHEPHGSPYESLIRREIEDLLDPNIKHVVTGNDNTVCFACHAGGMGKYSGQFIFNQVKHGSPSSTVVLAVYPGTDYQSGMCLNCHEPHGKTGLTDYKRASGNSLCIKCHDDETVNGRVYSYRGIEAYNATPHSTAEPFSASFMYYTAGTTLGYELAGSSDPDPDSLTDQAGSEKMSAATSNDGSRWITGLTSADSQYNYQVYKFKVTQEIAGIRRLNFNWIGYGEPTTGYMTDLKIWNGTVWEELDSAHLGGPADGTLTGSITANFSNYVNPDGDVYLLARARHDGNNPVISAGPTVTKLSDTSVRIQWTTNEPTTSCIDYGTSASYGQEFTDNALSTSHNVTLTGLTGLTTGVNWYYRVRSTDGVGNEVVSAGDYIEYKLPVFTAGPAITGHTASTATIEWTTDETTTAIIDYGSTLSYGSTLNEAADTSHTVTLTGLTGLTTTTKYYYRVRAYDAKNNLTTHTGEIDYTPPVISGVSPASGATVPGTIFNMTWTTNEAATSYVDYGLDTGYGLTAEGTHNVTSHTVPLSGLVLNTTYYYRIRSADISGNESSVTGTFITPANSAPSIPTLKAPLPADIYNTATTLATVNLYWNQATDPEGDPITYEVMLQPTGAIFTTSNTSMQVQISNYETVTWTWKVRAKDLARASDWSAADSFVHQGAAWTDTCSGPPDPGATFLASLDFPNKIKIAALNTMKNSVKTIAAIWNKLEEPVFSPEKAENRPAIMAYSIQPYLSGSPILYGRYGDTHYSLNTNYVTLEVVGADPEVSDGNCVICHAVHGQTDSSGNLIPKQLKLKQENLCFGNGSGCHSDGNNSVQKLNIEERFTANSNSSAHHSVTAAEQAAGGTKVMCSNCHDPHLNTPENKLVFFDTTRSPQSYSLYPLNDGGISDYVSVNGQVYLMVAAKHDGTPPIISSMSHTVNAAVYTATITWSTNENSKKQVEWGLDTDYGSSTTLSGLDGLTHSETITVSERGVTYHYRIVAEDNFGNRSYSADRTFLISSPPTKPTGLAISPGTLPVGNLTENITVSWNPSTDPDSGDTVYYQVSGSLTSGWMTSTSWNTTVSNRGAVAYTIRVTAKDNNESYSTPSDDLTFTHDGGVSCPNLYVWDGGKYEFITDMAGSDLGVERAPGVYETIFPEQPLSIPWGMLKEKNGTYTVKIKSERDEVDFIDYMSLQAVDHPADTRIAFNDIERGQKPQELYTYSDNVKPVRKATYVRNPTFSGGEPTKPADVTELVSKLDKKFASGFYWDDNQFTFDLGNLSGAKNIKLVINGWTEFSNELERQEARKKTRQGYKKAPHYLEVLQSDGTWKREPIKHINGFTKTSVIDLTGKFPNGTKKFVVRLRGMIRPRLDFVGVDTSPAADYKVTDLKLLNADLKYRGISEETKYPSPYFDYYKLTDTIINHDGKFTRYGDIKPLVTEVDDKLVVMDSGDEMTLDFAALPPPAPGMIRSFVIRPRLYYKEYELAKVEPMPFRELDMSRLPESLGEYPAHLREYIEEWNTRVHTAKVVKNTSEANTESVSLSSGPKDQTGFLNKVKVLFSGLKEWVTRTWAVMTDPSIGTEKALSPKPIPMPVKQPGVQHYSLNTDYVFLRINTLAATATYTADSVYCQPYQGSGSLTPDTTSPTSQAPGSASWTAATSANKTGASTYGDSQYWTTDLERDEGEFNLQLYQFNINPSYLTPRTLAVSWTGYGENSTIPQSHDVYIYLWNFELSRWDKQYQKFIGTPEKVNIIKAADFQSYCYKCHNNNPPTGSDVDMGATVNISSVYPNDAHGGFTNGNTPKSYSGMYGTSVQTSSQIKDPYKRNNSSLQCSDCHDPHGSANPYHLRENLNGSEDNTTISAYCSSCHSGTTDDFHRACIDCHLHWHDFEWDHSKWGPESTAEIMTWPTRTWNGCLDCHQHGKSFNFAGHGECYYHNCVPGNMKAF